MALYALGDLHLSFQVDKSMDRFGEVWINHEQKIIDHCHQLIKPEDTIVLTGDHSWGRKLPECEQDLSFIEQLPGRKILLRGNHDMFWDPKKTNTLNRLFDGRLHFLQDNFYTYEDYALVGTKGYTFEGPFYVDQSHNVMGWDEQEELHAKKLIAREETRLRKSIQSAKDAGYHKFIMFLHYPPTNIMENDSIFTEIAHEIQAEHVVYSHCHGASRFHDSIIGEHRGTNYHLVSGDYLDFVPECILK